MTTQVISDWKTYVSFGVFQLISEMTSKLTPDAFFNFLKDLHESGVGNNEISKRVKEGLKSLITNKDLDENWQSEVSAKIVNYFQELGYQLPVYPLNIYIIFMIEEHDLSKFKIQL